MGVGSLAAEGLPPLGTAAYLGLCALAAVACILLVTRFRRTMDKEWQR
jgi:hypothetical protein